MKSERASLNLRIPTDLKAKIEAYARRTGITLNAAACVLLGKAIDDE